MAIITTGAATLTGPIKITSGVGGQPASFAAPSIVVEPLSISGTPGPATVGTPYSFTPGVTGGSGTRFFVLTGTLPEGLSFSTVTGSFTGTPTTEGTTTGLSITVSDLTGSASLPGLSVVVSASGGGLPVLPEGFVFLIDDDGSYFVDDDQTSFFITEAA